MSVPVLPPIGWDFKLRPKKRRAVRCEKIWTENFRRTGNEALKRLEARLESRVKFIPKKRRK